MNKDIQWVCPPPGQEKDAVPLHRFGPESAKQALSFHESIPGYAPTPLLSLSHLAKALGVTGIYVKDESKRFDLNAFKVLGSSYAMAKTIAQRLMLPRIPSYDDLTAPETRARLGEITFVTATDGNHGRGVAWTAQKLGQKSVVYMPRGTAPERLQNIQALGADASITALNYDDAVRLARKNADEQGWILMQDTTLPGYETVPGWIMEGYTTMALEAHRQLMGVRPTHIFLQAGVGSMAGAAAAFFSDLYGKEKPVITIVEPDRADCLFQTAKAMDGQLHPVTGEMDSIMAGLCCGEPCTLAWQILRHQADCFVSMPDTVAACGMRMLGNPLPGDPRAISGESGAAAFGLAAELLRSPGLSALKTQLGLDERSVILCFSTEGDTDRENYRRIVWDGLFPHP